MSQYKRCARIVKYLTLIYIYIQRYKTDTGNIGNSLKMQVDLSTKFVKDFLLTRHFSSIEMNVVSFKYSCQICLLQLFSKLFQAYVNNCLLDASSVKRILYNLCICMCIYNLYCLLLFKWQVIFFINVYLQLK